MGVKIQSSKLQKPVWIAEDRKAAREIWKSGSRDTIYLYQEIEAMKEIDDESLKAIHMVKEVFPGGTVESIGNPLSDIPPYRMPAISQGKSSEAVKSQGRQGKFC